MSSEAQPRALGPVRWCIVLAVALVMAAQIAWAAWLLPFDKGADEVDHIRYSLHLCQERTLPDPKNDPILEAHHPPLYYALNALMIEGISAGRESLSRTFDNEGRQEIFGRIGTLDSRVETGELMGLSLSDDERAKLRDGDERDQRTHALVTLPAWTWRILRFPGLLMGLASYFFLLSTLRRLFPGSPGLVTFMVTAIASLPAFSFAFATVSNDALVIMLSTLASAMTLKARNRGQLFEWRTALLISIVLGLALLTKIHAIGAAVFCGLTVLWDRSAPSRGARWRSFAILVGGSVLVSGWWHLRQIMMTKSPVSTAQHADFHADFLRLGTDHPETTLSFFSAMITSFFGEFGNDHLRLPDLYYQPLIALTWVAAAGLVFAVFRRRRIGSQPVVWAAAVGVLCVLASLYRIEANYYARNGRYLMPLISLLAILCTVGCHRLLGRKLVPVLVGLTLWNLAFGLIFFGVQFRDAYTIDADKMERGEVIAYFDCGHAHFDQASAGGRALSQRHHRWNLPEQTLRLATQDGKKGIVYRVPLEGDEGPLQLRVRYPSPGNGRGEVPSNYGLVLHVNGVVVHGPMSIWGEFGTLRYAIPPSAIAANPKELEIWWTNEASDNPLVCVAELWIEKAWLHLTTKHRDDTKTISVEISNRDALKGHGGRIVVLGDGIEFAWSSFHCEAGDKVTVTIDCEVDLDSLKSLHVAVVENAPSPWMQRKLADIAPAEVSRRGRIEIPDVRVIRHQNTGSTPTLLFEKEITFPIAGEFEILLSHPVGQGPVKNGLVRMEAEGPLTLNEALIERSVFDDQLSASGWRCRVTEKGPVTLRLWTTAKTSEEAYDLDRIIVLMYAADGDGQSQDLFTFESDHFLYDLPFTIKIEER